MGCGCGAAGNLLATVSVEALARTGGFPKFTAHLGIYDGTDSDLLNGTAVVYGKLTVVTVTTSWVGDHYETHTKTEENWIDPILGDVSHYHESYDNGYWIDEIADNNSATEETIVTFGGDPATGFATLGTLYVSTGETRGDTVWTKWVQSDVEAETRSETTATLSGPRYWPGLAAAVALMDQIDIACNQVVTTEGAVDWNTGIPEAGGYHFTRQYARGPGGLIARSYASGYYGYAAGSWFGFTGARGVVVSASVLARPVTLWNRAAKCKVVMGKPTFMATKMEGDASDFTNEAWTAHVSFGLSSLWGSAACEPCWASEIVNRCLYAKEFRPADTYSPGTIRIENTPASLVTGSVNYDIDGNGVFNEVDNLWLYYNVLTCATAPPAARGMEGVKVELTLAASAWPLAEPLASHYYAFCDCLGNYSATLPANYEGTVSARVMVEATEFWFAFYTWGMTVEPFGTDWSVFSKLTGPQPNPSAYQPVSPLAGAAVGGFLFQPLPAIL